MTRITSITPMKNEGPFILEWLAYHMLIGINDFIVFTNDCTDGTDDILECLDELGFVRHLPNPSFLMEKPDGHHWAVMGYINEMKRLRRSDWIVSFDFDEFICVKTGHGTLADLFSVCDGADFISMNQLNFGCAGREAFDPDALMITQFDRAMAQSNDLYGWDRARGIKTISRGNAPYDRMGNHSPKVSRTDVKWVNGNGVPLDPEFYTKGPKFMRSALLGHTLVQLNHHATRSMNSFLSKTDRGDANHGFKDDVNHWRRYFKKYDDNLVEDTAMMRWAPKLRDAIDTLLQDQELARLHAAAVAHHKETIARLKESPLQAEILTQIRQVHSRKLERERSAA